MYLQTFAAPMYTVLYIVHTCTLQAVYMYILSHHDKWNILSTTLSFTLHGDATTELVWAPPYTTHYHNINICCTCVCTWWCLDSCAGNSASYSIALPARPTTSHSNSQAILLTLAHGQWVNTHSLPCTDWYHVSTCRSASLYHDTLY